MNPFRISIAAALVISLIALALIVFNTTPLTAPWIIRALFFVSLFIATGSALTLLIHVFRVIMMRAFLLGFSLAFLTLGVLLIRLI